MDDFLDEWATIIFVGLMAFLMVCGLGAVIAASEDDANEMVKREGAKYALEHQLTDKTECEFRLLTETTRSDGMWLAGCYEAVDILRTRK